jgi:hypothetical protein
MGEIGRLIHFSCRAAAFAIREQDAAWITDGVMAIAMIDAERVDFREVLQALSLLYHGAERTGVDGDQMLRAAIPLAEPGVVALIENFARRTPEQKHLQRHWGYDEVVTATGIGFINRSFSPYQSSYDMAHLAIEIMDLVAADAYEGYVTIATDLPKWWLSRVDDAALEAALGRIRAGAKVHADARPSVHPKGHSLELVVFLVEAEEEAVASTLLDLSRRQCPDDHGLLGLADERLFCLAIERTYIGGVFAPETRENLARFAPGLTDIMRRYVETAGSTDR